jgi:hypothetical protein
MRFNIDEFLRLLVAGPPLDMFRNAGPDFLLPC